MIVYAFKSGKYVLLLQFVLVITLGGNMNQISYKIKYKIKALRELNSLKQSDLARALNVSQQLVSSWERGVQLPDLNTVNQMTKFFNVSFDDLLSNKPIKPVATNDCIIQHELLPKLSEEDKDLIYHMITFMATRKKS